MAELYTSVLTYEPGCIEYTDFPDTNDPVWLLGRKYIVKEDVDHIREGFSSILWFTYRRNFPAIGGTGPTSDTGWGCMLRCGQMMLAQALIRRHLPPGWRWSCNTQDETYRRILGLFQDKKACTFSIHQISQMGVSEGKPVGEWFGPNTVAQAIKKLVQYDAWSGLKLHVAMDNMVILSDLKEEGTFPSWRPLLLVIPLRLGLTEMNPIYVEALKNSLTHKSSLGIIGGTPSHALYFIGVQGDEIIFLDPHTTHNFEDLDECFDDTTYHCKYAQRMNIYNIDPSAAMCFYFATEDELMSWCSDARTFLIDTSGHMLFEIAEKPHRWHLVDIDTPTPQCSSSQAINSNSSNQRKYDTSDEEFELL